MVPQHLNCFLPCLRLCVSCFLSQFCSHPEPYCSVKSLWTLKRSECPGPTPKDAHVIKLVGGPDTSDSNTSQGWEALPYRPPALQVTGVILWLSIAVIVVFWPQRGSTLWLPVSLLVAKMQIFPWISVVGKEILLSLLVAKFTVCCSGRLGLFC